jgi:hypothetical protein
MDLQHALDQLQTASLEWQTVYASSPNVRLRQQVSALQAAVRCLQEQHDSPPPEQSPAHATGVVAGADTTHEPPLLGKNRKPITADSVDHKTYRQRYITCGKVGCHTCTNGPGHGPYWYAYWREGTKIRSLYIGKQRPPP